MTINIKQADGGTISIKYKENVSSNFQTMPEGIRFYDPETGPKGSMRFMYWSDLDSIEYTHDVTEKERLKAKTHAILNTSSRQRTGPITTKSFG